MNKLAQIITKVIDFFYPPFRKLMSEQLFRYAACGGGNMVLDWVLYFVLYNFVIGHELIHLQFTIYHLQFSQVITPHIATLCIVFPITLLTGFWLQKNITFKGQRDKVQRTKDDGRWTMDKGQGAKQLMRYILIVAVNLAVNYFGLKLCVETFGWYPTPSKMLITLVTVAISYLGQKYYTFRVESRTSKVENL